MELETENQIAEFWKKNKIYEKLMSRKGKKFFVLDGPPYANGIPHIGHIKNTVFKDLIIRMNFMKGFNVLFQPGFDTHGLPVENMVEKKLNLGGKKEIEKFGVDKFVLECRNNATLNKDIWMKVYKNLGSLYQFKEPYLTYENYYLESAWWAFFKMYEKGLVYEGEKPVMWCSKCETSLAGYETTDSYKDVSDPGIYVLFKLKNSDEHLLVYTTTPWTLPANVAIAVAPKEEYVSVDCLGKKIILAKKRLETLSRIGFGYSILREFKGKELVGKKYEPLLHIPLQDKLVNGEYGKSHIVIASIPLLKERIASKLRTKKSIESDSKDLFEEFVTAEEGTGFVHTAPGHGKTDFEVGQHYNLAVVSPVNDQGEMIKELSGFSGFVKKADKEILRVLENEGKLLYSEIVTHSYPLCWRCKSPLIFRLSKQLFIKVDDVKKIILKENKKVKWMPEFAKERFENWVENAEDWNISRQRYWGIPIPLWKCECGNVKVIKSKEELEKLSGKKVLDLHAVENVLLPCLCGKKMKKFSGILDVWFDSGVAPFASMGYPKIKKELFETHFPVDRINEAQDQIRGWFYSLMFCSSAVFGKAPYKEVSMTGWVVDRKGEKMSKSLGNVIEGEQAISELSADVLRYYFCWDVNPYEIQKFNIDIAKKEVGKILNVLMNLRNLASNEKISKKLDLEDEWILSRLNSAVDNFNKNLDNFELKNAMRDISDFILNDFSRGYIQMTRDKENSAVVTVCVETLIRLLAPIIPFTAERIWQNLREKKIVNLESVHLAEWPKPFKNKINKKLEFKFAQVLKIIEIGLRERDKVQIGLKWPLAKAVIFSKETLSKELEGIIMNQLNVKKIEVKKSKEDKVELNTKITLELEAEGFAREISRAVQAGRKKAGLVKENLIKLEIFGELSSILKSQENFIKERVNAVSISFLDDKTTTFQSHENYDYSGEEKIKGRLVKINFKKI